MTGRNAISFVIGSTARLFESQGGYCSKKLPVTCPGQLLAVSGGHMTAKVPGFVPKTEEY